MPISVQPFHCAPPPLPLGKVCLKNKRCVITDKLLPFKPDDLVFGEEFQYPNT